MIIYPGCVAMAVFFFFCCFELDGAVQVQKGACGLMRCGVGGGGLY